MGKKIRWATSAEAKKLIKTLDALRKKRGGSNKAWEELLGKQIILGWPTKGTRYDLAIERIRVRASRKAGKCLETGARKKAGLPKRQAARKMNLRQMHFNHLLKGLTTERSLGL